MPADTTAPLKVRSAAKLAQPSRSDASEQQTKSFTQVGKASGWRTKSKPHTDTATFSPSGAKDVADTAAAAAAAVGSSAADALAMMPIIPAPADALGGAPSGSKHEQQRTAGDAVPQPAAAVPQKATAVVQDEAAQPTQDVPDAPGNAYLISYVAFLQRVACMLSRFLLCRPCL